MLTVETGGHYQSVGWTGRGRQTANRGAGG